MQASKCLSFRGICYFELCYSDPAYSSFFRSTFLPVKDRGTSGLEAVSALLESLGPMELARALLSLHNSSLTLEGKSSLWRVVHLV